MERSRKIIDLGVGTGYLLSQLVDLTTDAQGITAVDLSEQMLKNAQDYLSKHDQLAPRLAFEKADCRALPWPDNTFDLYVSSYLLDLLPESELRSAIQEMGRVTVSVFCDDSLKIEEPDGFKKTESSCSQGGSDRVLVF